MSRASEHVLCSWVGPVLLMSQSKEHRWRGRSPLTAGSTMGGQPGELEWLGVRGPIPEGASATNVLPSDARRRHVWQMDSFSRALLRVSRLCCWLMAGLPAHRCARFFIWTTSPEVRQQLLMRPCTHEWMGRAFQRHTSVQSYTQTLSLTGIGSAGRLIWFCAPGATAMKPVMDYTGNLAKENVR